MVTKSATRYLVDASSIVSRELLATSWFGAGLGNSVDGKLNATLLWECKNIILEEGDGIGSDMDILRMI